MINYSGIDRQLSGGTAVQSDPLVYLIDDFVSPTECDRIVELAGPRLERATVAKHGQRKVSDVRTNDHAFLAHDCDPIIDQLVNRLAQLIKIPARNAEDLQVVHYTEGQEYKPHQDAFDPANKDYQSILNGPGQRVMTILMYLNNVERGGGTGFPHLDVEIKARRGRVVIFQTCINESIEPHPMSLHGGLPVGAGCVKWAANLWFRERPFQRKWIETHTYSRVFD